MKFCAFAGHENYEPKVFGETWNIVAELPSWRSPLLVKRVWWRCCTRCGKTEFNVAPPPGDWSTTESLIPGCAP